MVVVFWYKRSSKKVSIDKLVGCSFYWQLFLVYYSIIYL